MRKALKLPITDLSSPDRISIANSIRQACIEFGFFYLVNHGVKEELLAEVLTGSRKFFSLPMKEKMKLARKEDTGYTPLYAENLDPGSSSKGDSKESYDIGPLEDEQNGSNLNQWPSQDWLPSWRHTMESYNREMLSTAKRLLSLIALSLNLNEDYFEKIGAMHKPSAFLRLLHYPGDLMASKEEICGASAHSDFGLVSLLASDGVSGLQVCKDKSESPQTWDDVLHIKGAFIVNIGDLMERWTNCLFRSTLHRVMPVGQERYSVAYFVHPHPDFVVECLKSCCSESSPPKFPSIRSGDYLQEQRKVTYATKE